MLDIQYLKKEVTSACQQAEWPEHQSYPKLLKVLHETFSDEYLVKHEKEIQGFVNDCAKYHGTFDFVAYFASNLQGISNGSRSQISREVVSMPTQRSNRSSIYGGPLHEDLAGLQDSPLLTSATEPPISDMMQYGLGSDAFTQSRIFREAERSLWKPIKAWCPAKERHLPLIAREACTKHSWVSEDTARKLEDPIRFDPGKHAQPEVVELDIGKVTLESLGLITVRYQPYNCIRHIQTIFNVYGDPNGPDLFIGQDAMVKVLKNRQQWSSGNAPESNSTPASVDPPQLDILRRRRGGSSFGSQASQRAGIDKAPASESQEVTDADVEDVGDTSNLKESAFKVLIPTSAPATQPPLSASREGQLHPPKDRGHFMPVSNLPLSPPPSRPPLSKAEIAFNLAFLTVMLSLALDILFFVGSKIRNPSREVTLGSGITFLLEICQQLLPNFEVTSLIVFAEASALVVGAISWYKTDMNFFRRLRH